DCYLDCSNTPIGEPCDWVCDPDWWYSPYNPATDYRGNLTQITSYADAVNLTGSVTETRRYDITGNPISGSSSCCQQTSYEFDVSTYYTCPLTQRRGSSIDPLQQVKTSATYDFNTGAALTARDANDRLIQTEYDPLTLRPLTTSLPSGGHVDIEY